MNELLKLLKESGLIKQSDASGAFPQVARAQDNDAVKKKKDPHAKAEELGTLEKDSTGIRVTNWFYASEVYAKSAEDDAKKMTMQPQPISNPSPDAEEQVQKIIMDNVDMNPATFLNTMKSQGLAVVDTKKAIESKKKKKKTESKWHDTVHCRFMESDDAVMHTGAHRFKVALIQEGLGNLRDAFYYTRGALESAISAFEGKKCYADHPSRSEESDRPERSVRDIVGHFEGVHIEDNADGSAALCADLVMIQDDPFEWARSLVRHAVEYSKSYPDKEFVGLSINAAGDAEPMEANKFVNSGMIPDSAKPKIIDAIEQGLTQVRIVSAIRDAVSTDLVTEAGAKGKVLEILESEKGADMKQIKGIFESEKKKEDEAKKEKHEAEKPEGEKPEAKEEKKEALPAAKKDGEEEPKHDDAEQDKKLIMDMIKKHMGGDNASPEEDEAMHAAHQAYEAYIEMGYESKDAAKCAGASMKLAKHMAQKQAMQQAEGANPLPKEAEKHESKEDECKKESEDEKKEDEKESHKEAMAKIVAENIALKKKVQESEFTKKLDESLKESKLSRASTDAIRKLDPRNERELEKYIVIFAEADKENAGNRGESKTKLNNIFVTSVEKQGAFSESKNKLSFADCKK